MKNWDHVPSVSLETLAPAGALIVLAPHPDDETLGCGGLIASAVDQGREVRVVVLTDGAASHVGSLAYSPDQIAALRDEELDSAARVLGLDARHLVKLARPDGRLMEETAEGLAALVRHALGDLVIGAIFTPGEDDPHPDHRAAARAARVLAQQDDAHLWSFPVRAHAIDAFLAAPQNLVRLDVRGALARKRAAIERHASQLGGLIKDDPDGFYLNADDINRHTQDWELFRRS